MTAANLGPRRTSKLKFPTSTYIKRSKWYWPVIATYDVIFVLLLIINGRVPTGNEWVIDLLCAVLEAFFVLFSIVYPGQAQGFNVALAVQFFVSVAFGYSSAVIVPLFTTGVILIVAPKRWRRAMYQPAQYAVEFSITLWVYHIVGTWTASLPWLHLSIFWVVVEVIDWCLFGILQGTMRSVSPFEAIMSGLKQPQVLPMMFVEILLGLIMLGMYRADKLFGIVLSAALLFVVNQSNRSFVGMHAESVIDPLTALFNRRHFEHSVGEALQTAQPISLIMIDIDHFKSFNDVHGHPAGDELLKSISDVFRREMRDHPEAIICRIGGEEFALVMPRVLESEAFNIGEHLRTAVENAALPGGEKLHGGKVTISVGVASATNGDVSISELVSRADVVLYEAKKSGRNVVVVSESNHLSALPT